MNVEIMTIVKEVLGLDEMIHANTDLFRLGLDSLGVLKIVAHIEDAFDIEIEDEDITFDNLQTIEAIVQMLSKYDRGVDKDD